MGLFGPPNVNKMEAKRDVEGLVKALNYSEDNTVRWTAAEALGKIGNVRAVEPLIAALDDSDVLVRLEAAGALGRIGSVRAVDPLIDVLDNERFEVRRAALDALDRIDEQSCHGQSGSGNWIVRRNWDRSIETGAPAAEPLIIALEDGERSDVRKAAAEALGNMGTPAVGPLIAALKDRDGDVREAAAIALARIERPAIGPLIAALKDDDNEGREVAAETLVKIGAPAVAPLIAALKEAAPRNSDATVFRAFETMRQTAASALVKIGAPAIVPLIAALNNQSTGAASTHVKMGASAVEQLIAALKECVEYERKLVIEVLGQIGDARAVDSIIAVLKESDRRVRRAAVDALINMGWKPGKDETGAIYWIVERKWDQCVAIGSPSVEPLIAALKDSGSVECEAVANALGKIGDARAIKPLIAALKRGIAATTGSQDKLYFLGVNDFSLWRGITATAGALDKVGWQPGEDEDGATYWVAKKQWDKCIEIGTSAVAPLIAALRSIHRDVRELAADVLAIIGTPAVEPLIAAIQDSDSDVRRLAACALGATGDARAVNPLIAAIKDKDVKVPEAAAVALGQIGDVRAVEPLIAALKSGNDSAIGALGQIGDARAVWPLIAKLDSTSNSGWDRKKAAESLIKLYRSGHLDTQCKSHILAQRGKMSVDHSDHQLMCGHADTGIGVAFQL